MRVLQTLPAIVSLSSGETNDAFCAFTGSTAPWTEIVHPDDRQSAVDAVARARESRERVQFRARLRDRDQRWRLMVVDGTTIAGMEDEHVYALTWHEQSLETEAAARFRAFMEHVPAVAILKDSEGRYQWVNRAFERYTGLTIDALQGRTAEVWMPPNTAERSTATCRRIAETQETYEEVSALRGIDGRERTFLHVVFPVVNANGTVSVGMVANDISELAEHERILEHRARTQRVVAQLGRETLHGNPNFVEASCRTAFEILAAAFTLVVEYDQEHEEAILRSVVGAFDQASGTRVPLEEWGRFAWTVQYEKATISSDLATEGRFSIWKPLLQAGARSAITIPILLGDRPYGMLAAYAWTPREYSSSDLDVLASIANLLAAALYRQRAESELAAQRQELRTIVDHAPDSITRIDRDLTVLFTNAATRDHGWELSELIGNKIPDLGLPKPIEDLWVKGVEHVFATGQRCEFETATSRSGRVLEVRMVPELDGDGQVAHAVAFARDVTAWQRAEEDRRHFQEQPEQERRAASVSRLATTVAHEFNNVLMSISPYAEIIAASATHDPRLQKAAASIRNAVARGRRVTHDIMRFTRPAVPTLRITELNSWLTSVVQSMMHGTSVPVALDLPPASLYAHIDPEQLEQAVTNLLFNARDAMAGRMRGTIRARLTGNDREIHITVEDDGAGIPPDDMDKLFEPFFTTKRSGTGLGLPVVKQIIERHGGRIDVENREGRGTAFTITIPASVRIEPPRATPRSHVVRGLRLLLIEDEPEVAEGIALLARTVHAEVRIAPDGASAMRELEATLPDAVLLDVGLPDMDGVLLFARIRSRWPSLPIVFSTGHGDQARLDEVLRLPHVGHLIKPYDIDDLLATIAETLK